MDNPACAANMAGMDSDILIAGGGLNGTLLALALWEAGLTSTIVDAHAEDIQRSPAFDGRGYALALASQRMLAALGLWTDLAAKAQPILEIKVSDGHAGKGASPFYMHFDHAEIEEGPMGFVIEDRHLRPVLIDAVTAASGITPITGTTVTGQSAEMAGAQLVLDDGTALSGRLIVGADGRNSETATRAGISRIGWDYGQTSLVCAVETRASPSWNCTSVFYARGSACDPPLAGKPVVNCLDRSE